MIFIILGIILILALVFGNQNINEIKSANNDEHKTVQKTSSNKKIERAGSIYGFTENSDGTGFLTEYNSVKFIYGHSINLILEPSITRLGGKAEIYLGETKFNDQDNEVIDNERVTVSADNVAFFKTEYINNNEENKVILYFRRGLMPNENYGQPSKCKVFLENIMRSYNDSQDILIELSMGQIVLGVQDSIDEIIDVNSRGINNFIMVR